MANILTEVTPKLLASGLRALRKRSIMPLLVNRAYDSMAGELGSTIEVPIPSAITATDVTPSAAQPSTPDIAPTKISLPMTSWKEAAFQLSDKDMMEVMNGTIPMQASAAVAALADAVDQSILAEYKKFYGYIGTAGTTPFGSTPGVTDATLALAMLSNQLCPRDENLRIVFDANAEASALALQAFHNYQFTGDADAIINGKLNRRFGFAFFMDQNVPTHTAGAGASYLVNSASLAIGDKAIPVDTGTGAFNAGEIITFAGHTQTYVITTAYAGGSGTLAIEPGLLVAVVDNAAITKKASHVANLAFHRDAIAFASRPLVMHGREFGVISESAIDPISGLTLRLEVKLENRRLRFAYDVLWGVATVRREFGVRIAG